MPILDINIYIDYLRKKVKAIKTIVNLKKLKTYSELAFKVFRCFKW